MRAQKSELRRHVLTRRDLVQPDEAHAAALAIAARGLELARSKLASGAVVAAYWPIRSEIGTRPLLDALHEAGFSTALPVAQGSAQPLVFRTWSPGDDLVRGSLGISEPRAESATVRPDLLFVPLAAFDARGGRIGYGAGHYDATLAGLRGDRRTVAVGLAYENQEIEAVPVEAHDQQLDFVLTPDRLLVTGVG